MNAPSQDDPQPEPDATEGSGQPPVDGVLETVDALAVPELVPRQRQALVARLARHAATTAPRWRPGAIVQWATDTVTMMAPRLPIRDRAMLRRHHAGLDGDALAQRLVRTAAYATAGVGAASGGLAAVKWTVPPVLLTSPVLLTAETIAVVAIEVKLVGELHHAYGVELPPEVPALAVSLLQSWARQRGFESLLSGLGADAVLGTAARTELRDRIARRFGRNLTTLAPLLTGAAVAGYLNQRATRVLGDRLRDDLRRPALPPAGPALAH